MWQRILLLFASLIVTAACTPSQPEATQPTPTTTPASSSTTSPTPTLEPTSKPVKPVAPEITKTPEPEPTPTPVKPAPTPEVTKTPEPKVITPEPKPKPTQPPQVNLDAPVRKPVTGSCDCPYDFDRRGRSCGKRSAYSRPGGRSPICYVRDQQ